MAGSRYARLIVLGALITLAVATAARAGDSPAQGMTIYRDPATGQLLNEPPPGAAVAVPRAQAPMVERQGMTPGGGVLLDGVPLSTITATTDAGGKVTARCEPRPAGGGE